MEHHPISHRLRELRNREVIEGKDLITKTPIGVYLPTEL